jgi:hypothetical protein
MTPGSWESSFLSDTHLVVVLPCRKTSGIAVRNRGGACPTQLHGLYQVYT